MPPAARRPFGVLFLSLSFFVIAAAVMLVLLFSVWGSNSERGNLACSWRSDFSGGKLEGYSDCEGLLVAQSGAPSETWPESAMRR